MRTRWKTPLLWLGISFALIVVFMFLPIVLALIGTVTAQALNCNIPLSDAGFDAAPCLLLGADIGSTLTLMVLLAYLGLLTIPAGTTALTIWAVVACVVVLLTWLRGRREA
jgi:hypothetical protein